MSQPYGQDPYGYQPQQPTHPPQHGYGYGYPPGPPPPRKKSSAPLILLIIGVVALVMFGGCAALIVAVGGGDKAPAVAVADDGPASGDEVQEQPEKEVEPSREPEPEGEAKVAGIGSPARDGKFEFTVTRMEKRDRVGSDFLGKEAQGVFLLVHVTVKNIGNESESFMGAEQKLFDEQGREFDASSEAAIYLDDSKSLYEKINPGNSVDGVVLFDIPKDVKPSAIELHDSIFSGGVRVSLADG
jgi:hypothetical protein